MTLTGRPNTLGPADGSGRGVDELIDVGFTFNDRPAAIPADIRTDWRIALLLLIVEACRGRRASLQQIQVLAWAAVFTSSQDAFVRAYKGVSDPAALLIRYDPAVTRAIDLAVGLGFLEWSNGNRLTMTRLGGWALGEIQKVDLLTEERRFLSDLGGKISMTRIDRLIGRV